MKNNIKIVIATAILFIASANNVKAENNFCRTMNDLLDTSWSNFSSIRSDETSFSKFSNKIASSDKQYHASLALQGASSCEIDTDGQNHADYTCDFNYGKDLTKAVRTAVLLTRNILVCEKTYPGNWNSEFEETFKIKNMRMSEQISKNIAPEYEGNLINLLSNTIVKDNISNDLSKLDDLSFRLYREEFTKSGNLADHAFVVSVSERRGNFFTTIYLDVEKY